MRDHARADRECVIIHLVYVGIQRVVVVAFVALKLQLFVQNRIKGTENLTLKLKVLHEHTATYKHNAHRNTSPTFKKKRKEESFRVFLTLS